jgi:hypothetical protein
MKTALLFIVLCLTTPAWAVPTVELTGGSFVFSANQDMDPSVHLPDFGIDVFPFNGILAGKYGGGPVRDASSTLSVSGWFATTPDQHNGGVFTIVAAFDFLHPGDYTAPFTVSGAIGSSPNHIGFSPMTQTDVLFTGSGIAKVYLPQPFSLSPEAAPGYVFAVAYTITNLPEPATWLLLLTGAGLLLATKKRGLAVPR